MIHLLDDSQDDLEIVERYLVRNGITDFKSFTDEELFLKELNRDVLVVLIDHFLPKRIGLQVMKDVIEKNPICYPIIVSGNDNVRVVLDYVNCDCFRYILKNDENYLSKIVHAIREAEDRISKITKYFNASPYTANNPQ